MTSPDRRRVLRVGTLGVLGAGVALGPALGGCSRVESAVDRVRDLAGDDPAESAPAVPAPSDPADPDVRLAVEVVLVSQAAATALRVWTDAGRRPRRMLRLAEAAAATHDAHADLVAAAVPVNADPATGRLAPALTSSAAGEDGFRSAVRIEELAGAGLREASLVARSGPFASLLAAMVAASAQQSALLRGVADTSGDSS
ncbi:hypothetical protein KLP28_00905 [Nocardioidaceae bacterium]|nr:hypothetical protein KLP28_00905 [Nocardioidaceae bacterium]